MVTKTWIYLQLTILIRIVERFDNKNDDLLLAYVVCNKCSLNYCSLVIKELLLLILILIISL